jgi:hypothetical protein
MIVDQTWKLTNTVRVGLPPRSSHTHRQDTFPDNVCSYEKTNTGGDVKGSVHNEIGVFSF